MNTSEGLGTAVGSYGGRPPSPLRAGLLAVGGLVLIGLLSTYLVLEIKTGLRAYASAESVWSRGVQDAVFHLDRFAETGKPEALARARAGLEVPLKDYAARQQVRAPLPDREAARRAFEDAGNHQDDIHYLIRTVEYFGDSGYFQRALAIWVEAEAHVFRLREYIEELAAGDVGSARRSEIRAGIARVREALGPLEREFSRELAVIDHGVNRIALGVVGGVLILGGGGAVWLLMWGARRLAASEQKMRATLEHAGMGMAVLTPAGVIRSVNRQFCDAVGWTCDDLSGSTLEQVFAASDPPLSLREAASALGRGSQRFERETQWPGPDGVSRYLRVQVTAVPDARGRVRNYIVVAEDVTDRHDQEDQLRHAAEHDPLTGLLNRRGFLEALEHSLASARESGMPHVLCFVDLDHFKDLNDNYGHRAGDAVLGALAELLRTHTRKHDFLARLGGDEFALILENCSRADGERIAEQVRAAVQELRVTWQEQALWVTASIGLVEIDAKAPDIAWFVELSDRACYRAKQEGRNRVSPIPLEGMPGTR